MGIPIPVFEVDADRARSNICLAADCQCPECRHWHIIRLGSAIRQTRRQELHNLAAPSSFAQSTTMASGEGFNITPPMPAGYIETRLPDYRFRHPLSPDPPNATITTTIMGDYHYHQHQSNSVNNPSRWDRDRDRDRHHRLSRAARGEESIDDNTTANSRSNYSTSALLSRRRALGYRGPPLTQIMSSSSVSVSNFLSPMMGNIHGSREPFTMSPTSMSVGQEQDHQDQGVEREGGPGHLEVALEATSLEGRPHLLQHQQRHQPHHQQSTQVQRPPPSSPLMRMRARAQEWASRMEGVDYYHDSDPEDLQGGGGGGGGGAHEGREDGGEGWMRRHTSGGGGGSNHRRMIMDRHERSSSDVGIEQSTIR